MEIKLTIIIIKYGLKSTSIAVKLGEISKWDKGWPELMSAREGKELVS